MASNAPLNPLAFSDEQQQLLALLLEEQGLLATVTPTIVRRDHQGTPPLSFAQERLWFLHQYETNRALYNIPMALHCHGQLDRAALEWAISEIVRRHEVLRARFRSVDGQPIQQIMPHQPLSLPLHDLGQLAPAQRQAAVAELLREDGQQPFDLGRDQLLRARLVRLAAAEHALLITVHHIVADGFSYSIFMRELKALYEAYLGGTRAPLPELPIQFGDVAAHQRSRLRGAVLEELLTYWRQQLAGAPAALDLPTDWARPPVQSYLGRRQALQLDPAMTSALKQLSRQLGVTLSTTLLTALLVLLYRATDQTDLVVGTTVANRPLPEVDGVIGLFVNTLALRGDLSGWPSFGELAARIGRAVLQAYEHQELPFEKLVEALQPERDRSRSPLFQVMFNFQDSLITNQRMGGLRMTLLEQPSGLAKFDLMLDITEASGQLQVELEYSSDLFVASSIQRMLRAYQRLLQGALADPACRIAALPLLAPTERRALLASWNHTDPTPEPVAIQHLFERMVAQTPAAPALVVGEQEISYRALDRRANQLAHLLQAHGVGPEVRVGVLLARTALLPVALLGILKAGGAYVPFDASYPAERLAWMVRDTALALVLTDSLHVGALPADTPLLNLDTLEQALDRQPTVAPQAALTPDSLAYLMYTSGSTGLPKGVAVSHRNVVRLVRETTFLTFTPADRVLHLAPVAFDASTLEIWGPLLNGAQLVLAPPGLLTLEQIGQTLRQQRITVVWLTAGLFHQLVEYQLADLRCVRTVLAGGDVLSVEAVRRVIQQRPTALVINGYGPTENTTFTCCGQIHHDTPLGARVPIGQPITNTQVYLLDSALEPVPPGMPGELYTGGAGLARGYWQRPDLTAERFVPHPFSSLPGARLYRTGDRVRIGPDDQLEFLGRADQQIKLRGFRIELGEIEAVLGQHPAVGSATVLLHGQGEQQRLVAYVTPSDQPPATPADLLAFLRNTLPSYMVPSACMLLDTLPLTPNGKLDRAALAALQQAAPPTQEPPTAARNPIEAALVQIWVEVLGVAPIGIHDNFFALGGHSLLATQVLARVEAAFQIKLPLRLLFESPTIADLAAALADPPVAPQPEGSAAIAPAQPDSLLETLGQLTDDDVDILLHQLLAEEGTP